MDEDRATDNRSGEWVLAAAPTLVCKAQTAEHKPRTQKGTCFEVCQSKIENLKSKMASSDHLIRPQQHIRRNRDTDLLRCLEIDYQLELHWLLHREISGFPPFENLVNVYSGVTPHVWNTRAVRHKTTVSHKNAGKMDCWQLVPRRKINNLVPTICEERARGY